MKLTMRRWDNDDVYAIERAVHDNTRRDVTMPNGVITLRKSSRIVDDSDLEGSKLQMMDIICAIRGQYDESTKHCRIVWRDDVAYFDSPRCSNHGATAVTKDEAQDLADQMEAMFAGTMPIERCGLEEEVR